MNDPNTAEQAAQLQSEAELVVANLRYNKELRPIVIKAQQLNKDLLISREQVGQAISNEDLIPSQVEYINDITQYLKVLSEVEKSIVKDTDKEVYEKMLSSGTAAVQGEQYEGAEIQQYKNIVLGLAAQRKDYQQELLKVVQALNSNLQKVLEKSEKLVENYTTPQTMQVYLEHLVRLDQNKGALLAAHTLKAVRRIANDKKSLPQSMQNSLQALKKKTQKQIDDVQVGLRELDAGQEEIVKLTKQNVSDYVQDKMGDVTEQLNHLQDKIGDITEKLNPVLNKLKIEKSALQSDVGAELRNYGARAKNAVKQMDDLVKKIISNKADAIDLPKRYQDYVADLHNTIQSIDDIERKLSKGRIRSVIEAVINFLSKLFIREKETEVGTGLSSKLQTEMAEKKELSKERVQSTGIEVEKNAQEKRIQVLSQKHVQNTGITVEKGTQAAKYQKKQLNDEQQQGR